MMHTIADRRSRAYILGHADARQDMAGLADGLTGSDDLATRILIEDVDDEECSALWLAYYHGRHAARDAKI